MATLEQKISIFAGLSHTSYERTRENTLEYTSGHQFKPELTFNYAPDNTQFFTAYYWHTQEDPLRYATFDRITKLDVAGIMDCSGQRISQITDGYVCW